MKNKTMLIAVISCAVAFLDFGLTNTFAQPSAAQIKKDISGPKTVSVTFNSPGKIEWDSAYKKYIWSRDFVATVRTDEPGVLLKVNGIASYDVMGGRYVYWRTFTSKTAIRAKKIRPSRRSIRRWKRPRSEIMTIVKVSSGTLKV